MRNLIGVSLFSFLRDVKDKKERCDLLCDSEWTLLCLNVVFPEAKEKPTVLPFVAMIADGRIIEYTKYRKEEAWYNNIYLVRCLAENERTI